MLIIILFFITALYFFNRQSTSDNSVNYIRINNCKFKVEIADTPQERFLGLGKREKICQNCGMLFEFHEKGEYPFCMRDMKFPLGIIWISDDNVVSVIKDVPCNFKGEINSHVLADKVLELNAGTAKKCGIKKGDKISY
ncbi:DUF192 domain-containing protein [bacterium]|nr:DUF192 domain-containing protein [bacterium]